jgi:hypothetical protein
MSNETMTFEERLCRFEKRLERIDRRLAGLEEQMERVLSLVVRIAKRQGVSD